MSTESSIESLRNPSDLMLGLNGDSIRKGSPDAGGSPLMGLSLWMGRGKKLEYCCNDGREKEVLSCSYGKETRERGTCKPGCTGLVLRKVGKWDFS